MWIWIVFVCCTVNTEHISSLCGKNAEILILKLLVYIYIYILYSNNWSIKEGIEKWNHKSSNQFEIFWIASKKRKGIDRNKFFKGYIIQNVNKIRTEAIKILNI